MPTIYDVASQAKVSIAAGLPGNERCQHDSRWRSQAAGSTTSGAAHWLHAKRYRPGVERGQHAHHRLGHTSARADLLHPFIAGVLSGMQNCVSKRDYHLMIYSHTAGTGRVTRGEIQQSRYADGVIVSVSA